DPHFQVNLAVPVERDVPTRTLDLLRADDAPHGAAGVGHDFGKFLRTRPTAHNRKRTTAELFESDIVFHANHLGRLMTNAQTPRSTPALGGASATWFTASKRRCPRAGTRRRRPRRVPRRSRAGAWPDSSPCPSGRSDR